MQTDMLVSGFPGRGYLSAASPMLVALCTCVMDPFYADTVFHSPHLSSIAFIRIGSDRAYPLHFTHPQLLLLTLPVLLPVHFRNRICFF